MWFRCCAKSRGRSRASISGSPITRNSCAREPRSRISGHPPSAVIGVPGRADRRGPDTAQRGQWRRNPHRRYGHRRGHQIRQQQLARPQSELRQRNRPDLQGERHRWTEGHGGALRRPQAQHLAGLSQAGVCLRRLLSTQGSPRAALSRQDARRAELRARCRPGRQSASDRSGHRHGRAQRQAPDRDTGTDLQARYRRPAREPPGRAGGAADRQGLRGRHL